MSVLEEKPNYIIKRILSKLPVLSFDITSILIAWFVAYALHYESQPLYYSLHQPYFWISLLWLMLTQTACYYYFKVYRGVWHFASLNDVLSILRAVLFSFALSSLVFLSVGFFKTVSFSVLILYAITLTGLLCGSRLFIRAYWDQRLKAKSDKEVKRVLIVGAGMAGEGLLREMKRTGMYEAVGLADDDKRKQRLEIHGVRVLGGVKEIPELVDQYLVDLIFIAIPSARSSAMRRIIRYCEESQVPIRTLPGLYALASGHVEINNLRDVSLEDLLGRDQVELSWDKISLAIEGKRVLVTGGGGSIGSELCRQMMRRTPSQLLILDNCEYNLYQIEYELTHQYPNSLIDVALVNVVDDVAVKELFRKFKPEMVFHAAAYKHVPMLEDQVREAVLNNIIGTQVIAEASVAVGVDKFIYISTDKAVNPTNIMGTSKRVAEIYCQNLNQRVGTQFITVRFGNVLGSVGSVVPLFQKQLKQGGPLTVTHPEIKRYFMTIPEACLLILQAMVIGEGGEIFVLDMGEPVKIQYLAEQLIRLTGKEPGKDIDITYTGLRPGEKLFEELFHPSEELQKTGHEKLFQARFREVVWQELEEAMRLLKLACEEHQDDELVVLLQNIVPEFVYDEKLKTPNSSAFNLSGKTQPGRVVEVQ